MGKKGLRYLFDLESLMTLGLLVCIIALGLVPLFFHSNKNLDHMTDTMVSGSTVFLSSDHAVPGVITQASRGCSYQIGTPSMVFGALKTQGLAGDTDHVRVTVQDPDHPACHAFATIDKAVLVPFAQQRLNKQRALRVFMQSLPPPTMQDAIALSGHE